MVNFHSYGRAVGPRDTHDDNSGFGLASFSRVVLMTGET